MGKCPQCRAVYDEDLNRSISNSINRSYERDFHLNLYEVPTDERAVEETLFFDNLNYDDIAGCILYACAVYLLMETLQV
jgi:hypothetical protein